MRTLIARDVEAQYNSQQYLLTGVDVAGFSKVFSTMWGGSLYGRFEASAVFMVLLSLCNRDGVVDMTPEAIAGQTGWPIEVIRKGIAELESVDPRSRTPDHDGRRILKLDDHRDWGWRITNYVKYRDQLRAAERREYLRQAKERERASKRSTPVNSVNNVNQCQPIAEADAEADKNNTSADASLFASFWSSWPSNPRKQAKSQCAKLWNSKRLDEQAAMILAHVKAMSGSLDWTKDGGAYIPAPLVYLRQERWSGAELPPDPEKVELDRQAVYERQLQASIAAMQRSRSNA